MAVAEALRTRGWTVLTQIGVSKFRIDLGVVQPDAPGRFLSGVECDGATYHRSPSARDRDRVRHIILENLGWRLFRIFSTDFFVDPEAAIEVLDARLRQLLEDDRRIEAERRVAAAAGAPGGHASETADYATVDDVEDPTLPAVEDWDGAVAERGQAGADDENWQPDDGWGEPAAGLGTRVALGPIAATKSAAVPLPAADPARFYGHGYRPTLQAMGKAIIDGEGPITFKRLSDQLARLHGFQRTGKEIRRTVWAACSHLRAQPRRSGRSEARRHAHRSAVEAATHAETQETAPPNPAETPPADRPAAAPPAAASLGSPPQSPAQAA